MRVKDWLTFGEEIDVPLDLLVLGVGECGCRHAALDREHGVGGDSAIRVSA